MAFPPVPAVPSGVRENTTPQVNTHPTDHMQIHQALSDIINELGANPSGDAPNLTAWLAILCPVGEIKMWGGSSAPSGWAMCNGDAVSRVTYADLFAVIGTNFGIGDGGSTFNLPNLIGRSPMGLYPGGGWGQTIGALIGTPQATLILHDHGGSTPPGEGGVNHQHQPMNLSQPVHGHNLGNDTQIWWVDPNGWKLPAGLISDTNTGFPMAAANWHHDGNQPVDGNTGPSDRDLNHRHSIAGAGAGDGVNANIHPVTIVNFIIRMT